MVWFGSDGLEIPLRVFSVPWDSEHAPAHRPAPRGRHRAVRPDQVGRALKRALFATFAPGLVLLLFALILTQTASQEAVKLALDPDKLLGLAVVLGVVWALWIALICRAYTRNRARVVSGPLRAAGAAGVFVMCAAVTAPMAMGAYYSVTQRDLIVSVFRDEPSATTPDGVSASNPWGNQRRVNVLLLGGDGDVHRDGIRTDSVILASIDTKNGRTTMFSLPRNLQRTPFKEGTPLAEAYPDGFTSPGRETEYLLNAVYKYVPEQHPGILGKSANEGADAVKLAVSGALGLRVDYYVLINLRGFRQLVDAMGGITVNVNERVPIGGNTSLNIQPDDWIEPGPNQELDGFKALWFTRGRFGSTDYSRMQRQRCAIQAIASEASPMSMLQHYTGLAKASKRIVRTDIPRDLLPAFAELAGKVKGSPIKSVGFERSDKFDPNDPDFEYVQEAVLKALYPRKYAASTPTPGLNKPNKPANTKAECAYRPVEAGSD